MQCALNAITEHHQQYPLALIIPFQVVQRKMKRFVWCYLQNNPNHYSKLITCMLNGAAVIEVHLIKAC